MTDKNQESGFIDDPLYKPVCSHQNHKPPYNIHIPEGKMYRHVCPSCGEVTIIRRMPITCSPALPVHPSPFPYSLGGMGDSYIVANHPSVAKTGWQKDLEKVLSKFADMCQKKKEQPSMLVVCGDSITYDIAKRVIGFNHPLFHVVHVVHVVDCTKFDIERLAGCCSNNFLGIAIGLTDEQSDYYMPILHTCATSESSRVVEL